MKIIDGIGSTEMLHIFIAAADDDIRPGSTGKAVPGYTAAVVDDDGKPVPDGQPGRLAVKGPTGCRYLNDERQRTYVQDGWNLTGDTYVRDADGYFWYQARSDDMIISGGYNIAGPEIEEVLLSHPDVAECGVVGVPDEARGQIVKAYVILRERRRRRRGQGARAAGPRQGPDRAVQVPASGRVRHDAAPHQHRQAAAIPAARAGRRQQPGRTWLLPGYPAQAARSGRRRRCWTAPFPAKSSCDSELM